MDTTTSTARSSVEITECPVSFYMTARGGTRRERGAALAAQVRKHVGLTLMWINYSETYGFDTATYARYSKPASDRDQPTEGDAVTLDVPGAWHYGQAGRVLATSADTGITVVIYPNGTTVPAPTTVVRPA